jgi:hypothetical protein
MIVPSKSLTLVCVDTVSPLRSLPAFLRVLEYVKVRRALFFHCPNTAGFAVPGVEFIPLAGVSDRETENKWQVCELHKYVETEMVFVVEHDSWLVNPTGWSEEFLGHDYIGPPWTRQAGNVVGNSGFHIKSRRFCEATAAHAADYAGHFYPHDIKECEVLRPKFVADGMVWAPVAIAAKFGWERSKNYPTYNGAFGIHGAKEWKDYVK